MAAMKAPGESLGLLLSKAMVYLMEKYTGQFPLKITKKITGKSTAYIFKTKNIKLEKRW